MIKNILCNIMIKPARRRSRARLFEPLV